ncbi:MAG: hypothetical protein MUC95_08680 [Spirochaetes bacterium]|nr:hypothetical protein [Spirochaetota bacterium]
MPCVNSRKLRAAPALFLILFFLPINTILAGNIFIFNPEGNVQQARAAKIALEKHLEDNGISSTVYIFGNPKDFDEAVERLKPDFAVVSSYYFDAMIGQYKWQDLLSGFNAGSQGFRKILVTPDTINSPEKLKNQGIATISLGPSTIKFADERFLSPIGLSATNVRLVTVSKDIDAIMALGFGQVKGAIVTRESFSTLQRINPEAVKSLTRLRELPLILYPKVVSFPWAKDREKIKSAFQKLENRGDTGILLKFLGITNFN